MNEGAERLKALLDRHSDDWGTAEGAFHGEIDDALADERKAGATEERERIRAAWYDKHGPPSTLDSLVGIHDILDAEAER